MQISASHLPSILSSSPPFLSPTSCVFFGAVRASQLAFILLLTPPTPPRSSKTPLPWYVEPSVEFYSCLVPLKRRDSRQHHRLTFAPPSQILTRTRPSFFFPAIMFIVRGSTCDVCLCTTRAASRLRRLGRPLDARGAPRLARNSLLTFVHHLYLLQWGGLTLSFVKIKNYESIVALRVVLGAIEAGFYPGGESRLDCSAHHTS